ncbi:2'-5' RNA ligase [Microbacterium sp. BE35]|uniref:2'-5' RNA ligase family protein n=1 Tax=Microbacterium sp. BE35 TaxID=2817773 RepID=UPI002854BC6F|nr:2'-5' RNA ligase family protein [Microbacterium sp. BE35]MDR7189540.1 2'-5' RNA ligase [Microbacterium sp. BE35]
MEKVAAQQLFVVVALFRPVGAGTSFDRREWPAHVTLVSNFSVTEHGDRLARTVSEVCADHGPLSVRFAAHAMFGRDKTVPVQLVDSADLHEMHERLADLLEVMPGFAAADPDYWRAGYQPHMTDVPTVTVRECDIKQMSYVAVVALTGNTATVTTALTLSHEPDGA